MAKEDKLETKPETPIVASKTDLQASFRLATKSPAELRMEAQAEERKRRDEAGRVTTLVPVGPETVHDVSRADEMLSKASKDGADEAIKRAAAGAENYVFFVKCRISHGKDPQGRPLPQHGIYLLRNTNDPTDPRGRTVKQTEWYSRYKPKATDPWTGPVVCQVCLQQRGEEVELDVDMEGRRGEFSVRPRWLWRRPKDEARLRVEGETRANEVGIRSANMGREDASNRAIEAGMEALP
jgi:hypothetical protein